MARVRFGWFALLPALIACTGTRTGNPVEDSPPRYETPSRFSPEVPGGGNPGGAFDPGNQPTHRRAAADFAAWHGAHLVVFAQNRGLLVYDVSDPGAPSLRGELPIDGRPMQLEVDAGWATLAVLERTAVESDELPDGPLPQFTPRLLRIDLADPERPRRAAEVDLEGEFWQFERREGRYFVLAQISQPTEPLCNDVWNALERRTPPRATLVTSYELDGDTFAELERVELPADARYAYAAGFAYFTVNGYAGIASGQTASLEWVDFSSGALVRGSSLPLPGRPLALDRDGSTLVLAVAAQGGALALHAFELDAQLGASERGVATVPGSADGSASVRLLSNGRHAVVDRVAGPVLVDLDAPSGPAVASRFPEELLHLIEVPEGLLGIGHGGGPNGGWPLVASLWTIDDPSAPVERGRVETDWFYPHTDLAGFEPWRVDAERSTLLLPFNRPPASATGQGAAAAEPPWLGVLRWDQDGLRLELERTLRAHAERPLTDGQSAFCVSHQGLEIVPLDPEATPTFTPFDPPHAKDQVTASGSSVQLWEREDDGVFYLRVSPQQGGGEARELELSHRGDALLAMDGAVVVLGLRGEAEECEYFAQLGIQGEVPQPENGVDPCAEHRARGLSVLTPSAEPAIAAVYPITSDMDLELAQGVDVRSEWLGYVTVPDGPLVLLAQRIQRCQSTASCDALGVPAHETLGAPGCNPQVQNCDELPAVEVLVSGHKAELLVYALDLAGANAPRFELAAVLDGRFPLQGESSLDLASQVFVRDDGLGLARDEAVYDESGNSARNEHEHPIVRFHFERIVKGPDGALAALPAVNTPGRTVAWRGDTIYTLEPSYTAAGAISVRLHRAELRGGGAFVADSASLGTGFLDARALSDQLFVLRGPEDPCADDPSTDLFAVDLEDGALARGDALTLPGRQWAFAQGAPLNPRGELLLSGGPLPGGHLTVDIADPTKPRIVRYASF